MMHEHNTDLIMALAEGSLDPANVAAAEAEVASCSECTVDLTLQRTALAALSAAPPAAMNEIERSRIRRSLRDGLGLTPATATAARPSDARRYRLFAGLASAAAVLIAVVLVAPGLDLLGGNDDAGSDAAFEVLGAATTAPTNGGQSATERSALSEAPTAAEERDGGGDLSQADAAGTTGAPATTAAPAAIPEGPNAFSVYSSQQLDEFPGLTAVADAITEAGSLDGFGPPGESSARLEVLDEERCLQLGLDEAPDATEAFVIALSGIDDVEVVLVAYISPSFEVIVLAHDLETCQVLASS